MAKRNHPLPLDPLAPRQARILPTRGYSPSAKHAGWMLWLRYDDESLNDSYGKGEAAPRAHICDVARDVHGIGSLEYKLCPVTAWDTQLAAPLLGGTADLVAWLPLLEEGKELDAAFPQWGVFYIAPAGSHGCTAKTAAKHIAEWAEDTYGPWRGGAEAWGAPASLASGRALARPVRLLSCPNPERPCAGSMSFVCFRGIGGEGDG